MKQTIAILLIIIVILCKFIFDSYTALLETEKEVKSLNAEISVLTKRAQQTQENLIEVSKRQRMLQSELEKRKIALARLEARQETVFKKPSLVEKMINNSYSDFEKEVECATLSQSQCHQS